MFVCFSMILITVLLFNCISYVFIYLKLCRMFRKRMYCRYRNKFVCVFVFKIFVVLYKFTCVFAC